MDVKRKNFLIQSTPSLCSWKNATSCNPLKQGIFMWLPTSDAPEKFLYEGQPDCHNTMPVGSKSNRQKKPRTSPKPLVFEYGVASAMIGIRNMFNEPT